jgi:hypothetical protein
MIQAFQKILRAFIVAPMRATRTAHFIFLAVILFGENYEP